MLRSFSVLPVAASLFALTACAGRTPLDRELWDDPVGTGITDAGGTTFDASVDDSPTTTPVTDSGVTTTPVTDSGVTTTPTKDSGIDIWDVFPIPDSGPIGACATCVKDSCGAQVNDCLNDAACRSGVTCTVTKCLTGGGTGGFDIACVLGCFGGDTSKAFLAVSVFTCITSTCGKECTSLLPGADAGPGRPDAAAPDAKPAAHTVPHRMSSAAISPEDMRSLDPGTRFEFDPSALDPWATELCLPLAH
jgi:hypothetical protein